jgi:hypothetical protein
MNWPDFLAGFLLGLVAGVGGTYTYAWRATRNRR